MNGSIVTYSVIVPVYNSEKSLHELGTRLIKVFAETVRQTFEIILIDDASTDDSWSILRELRQKDTRIRIFRLMKNSGQHNATLCGLRKCRGEFVVTLDDDLQNPPEEIPKLIEKLQAGYDVVIGVPEHKRHGLYRNLGSRLIDLLLVKIFQKPKDIRFSPLKLMRRNVVDRIVRVQSCYCYLAAYILRNVSHSRIVNVTVEHGPRKYGRSNYSTKRIIALASNLIFNFSSIPLRIGIYFGFLVSFGCIMYSCYILFRELFIAPIKVQGWATLAILISFLFGVLFLFLGTIGEYVYRILREVAADEQYVIQDACDGDDTPIWTAEAPSVKECR